MNDSQQKPPASGDNDWIGDRILSREDELMKELRDARFASSDASAPHSPMPAAVDVSVDPAAEAAAFAELIASFAANPEADCEIIALTADAFAQGTFTPAEHKE